MPNKRSPITSSPAPKKQPKKSSKKTLVILALIVAIALAAILGMKLLSPKEDFGGPVEVSADTSGFTEELSPETETSFVPNDGTQWFDAPSSDIVAEYNGGSVTAEEVLPLYEQRLSEQMFGEDTETDSNALKEEVIRQVVRNRVLLEKAEALGLTENTAEETAALEREAAERYADRKALYAEDGKEAADDETMADLGITEQSILEQMTTDLWMEKLANTIDAQIEIGDDELRAAYEALVTEQKALFDAEPSAFSTAANSGEPIVYIPENSRSVQSIFLAFKDIDSIRAAQELFDAIAASENADEKIALNDQLNSLYADLDARANTILARLQSGESFEALMDEVGEDETLRTEPMRSRGYYVNPSTNDLWSDEYVEGCLYLESPGQYTPVSMRSPEGVHIIRLKEELPAGVVSFEEARDSILARERESRAADAFEAQAERWMDEANVVIHADAFEP